jgi:hypothetical protein
VVVRDDNWGTGATPFAALRDPSDNLAGRLVVQNQGIPGGAIGQQRLGASNLTIAVDPRDSRRVYVAWAEGSTFNSQTLQVRRSVNSGVDWSDDLLAIPNAVNPALAINIEGKVGFLYQKLMGTAPNQRGKPIWLEPPLQNTFGLFKEFSCFLARANYSPISAFLTNSANRRSSGRRPGSWRWPRLAMAFHLRCPL